MSSLTCADASSAQQYGWGAHQTPCMVLCTPCRPGKECVLDSATCAMSSKTCPAGSFCPGGMTDSQDCPLLAYCPEGSATPKLSGIFPALVIGLVVALHVAAVMSRRLRCRAR